MKIRKKMIRTYLFEPWLAPAVFEAAWSTVVRHALFLLTRLGPVAKMLAEQEEGYKYIDYPSDTTKNHE